ncbi:MAG: ChaN family lipoprotein [Richelia sp.]|nr:ChaN family lipoprotein [Richelia sp.]CDN13998.1 hypothetical protein RintRC_5460 [Richelia intracellularis]
MKKWKKLHFSLLTFTFAFLLCLSPTYAQEKIENDCTQKFTPSQCLGKWQHILPELQKAQVVYLGETHDSETDHQNQLQVIQQLYKGNRKNGVAESGDDFTKFSTISQWFQTLIHPLIQQRRKNFSPQEQSPLVIAMEMFQRPYQDVVNQYLAGKITEAELVEKSEYKQRWGFPWEYYAPILRFAKAKKLPVLALNTPSEVTRKVARQGLSSLTPSERKFIPPLTEIRTENQEYRQLALAAFQKHQAAGHGNSASADPFFAAQVVWDETMAEGIANFIRANPNSQVVVLAGQGHIIYGYGIPSRVARRLRGIKQRSVILRVPSVNTNQKEQANAPSAEPRAIADFIYQGSK